MPVDSRAGGTLLRGMKDITLYSPAVQMLTLVKYGQVTPRMYEALIARFGSIEKVLQADAGSLGAISGMTAKAANSVAKCRRSLPLAEEFLNMLEARDIRVSSQFDGDFPTLLFELNDPPPLLYVRGSLPEPARKSVALVGTSEASNEGIEMTTRLAKTFAENRVQVISTLRGGIGDAAHLGCRAVEGHSFAVLEGGFDAVLDEENMPVAIDIVHHGGVISEYQPDQAVSETGLVESNRLIVGLSQAVVVTEFYGNSIRTLDLLKFCSQIGKLVFVMIDPEHGAFSDEKALGLALEYGAIPLKGYDKVDDIIKSLV